MRLISRLQLQQQRLRRITLIMNLIGVKEVCLDQKVYGHTKQYTDGVNQNTGWDSSSNSSSRRI